MPNQEPRTPTPDQEKVLVDPNARIRVVRASPGSGKTWLVAEAIRRELPRLPGNSGIAALSFTRVGGEEIRIAIDSDLEHPHFVGTIDSFLSKFVLRPYICNVFKGFVKPQIIPSDWGVEKWDKWGQKTKATVGHGINIFGCVYINEINGNPQLARRPYPGQSLQPLQPDINRMVHKAKESVWKSSGLLTHSDAAMLASRILSHPIYGAKIRAEVIHRFPFLVVDELQDTGHFLGRCIRSLLEEPTARGLLVGDPDQAIYEFSGARPELFKEFETMIGAVAFSLPISLRCSPAVATAASHLKDSKGAMGVSKSVGRAILLRYTNFPAEITKLAIAVCSLNPSKNIKTVARSNSVLDDIWDRQVKRTIPNLYCPATRHIHSAVVEFRKRNNSKALGHALAAISRAMFRVDVLSDEDLAEKKIDLKDWKSLAINSLLNANSINPIGTFMDWHVGAALIIDEAIHTSNLFPAYEKGKLKPQQRPNWDKPCTDYLSPSTELAASNVKVSTVHGAKGETHDLTIFISPPKAVPCISVVWWSQAEKDREEKRIAYVAMTRSKGDLLFCVSEDTFGRLEKVQKDFVECFEVAHIEDYILTLNLQTKERDSTQPVDSGATND